MKKIDGGTRIPRVFGFMAGYAAIGTVAAGVAFGASEAAGFLLGSIFSAGNLYLWHRLVRSVGETSGDGESPQSASVTFFGLRYFLFVGAGYFFAEYFRVSIPAALAGCFVAALALVTDMALQLRDGA